MKRTRKINKKEINQLETLNEGVYDFYKLNNQYGEDKTTDAIVNYYIDKIRKYGQDSLTQKEVEVFNQAKNGKLTLDNPVYKRHKTTGAIEYDKGNPIRIDNQGPVPGVPFVTSKGKGVKRKEVINGRVYWNVDDQHKAFYVFGPEGLIIWKTVSSSGKDFGAFLIPKSEAGLRPEELWESLAKKFDKGFILKKEDFMKFLEFDKLYHESRKLNMDRISKLYRELCAL